MNHNLQWNTATALTAGHRITIAISPESKAVSGFASRGLAVLTSRRLLPWKRAGRFTSRPRIRMRMIWFR